jgi:hypothetical protein
VGGHAVSVAERATGPDLPERVELIRAALLHCFVGSVCGTLKRARQ